jgi:hypothetical protein
MSFRVKNWKEFQHYQNRKPPWIKLHRGLLDDYDWHRLPDASKALAPMLWLLASESEEGLISLSAEEIAFRLRTTEQKVDAALKPLISAGFLSVEQVASNALATRYQDACSEREGETEEKKERESRASARKTKIPVDWKPTAEELAYAAEHGCPQPSDTAERFHLHHTAKGTLAASWAASWKYWCRNEKNFSRANGTRLNGYPQPPQTTQIDDSSSQWGARMRGWHQSKFWKPYEWGPEPGNERCLVPPHLLREAA